jgi:GT2 family glycosyltransferase
MSIDLHRSSAPRVSVIIAASSTPELLRACLYSMARSAPGEIPFETIVVLNEADSGVEAELLRTVTGLHVVNSPVNLGLAGAANRGRHLARGDLLIVLHDDAEVEPGWMEALVETADAHPEAGAIGGKVLNPDGSLQNAGMILWRDATTSPPWVGKAPAPDAFDRVRAVDYCGTSSLLVRASAWDAVGGLDERFYPAYYADVDLSLALRQRGLVVLYQPRSVIRHHRGASTNIRFRSFIVRRNRLLFLEKWGSALAEYDPPEAGSRAALERALERAEAFAALCRSRGAVKMELPPERVRFDPALQELRHYEKSRALQKAYVAHLTESLDAAEKELARSGLLSRLQRLWRRRRRSWR